MLILLRVKSYPLALTSQPRVGLALAMEVPEEAPFRRDDQYGDAGLRPQPLRERLFTWAMALTLLPVRAAATLGCVASLWALCKVSALTLPPATADALVARGGKTLSRLCLLALGFWHIRWVKVPGPPGGQGEGEPQARQRSSPPQPVPVAAGIISNHCSWLDILIHMSRCGTTQPLPMALAAATAATRP